jgi:uncharacterized protein YkwD
MLHRRTLVVFSVLVVLLCVNSVAHAAQAPTSSSSSSARPLSLVSRKAQARIEVRARLRQAAHAAESTAVLARTSLIRPSLAQIRAHASSARSYPTIRPPVVRLPTLPVIPLPVIPFPSSSSSSHPVIVAPRIPPAFPSDGQQGMRQEILRLVNAARADAGVQPLTLNPILTLSAQNYAADMDTRQFFSHQDPDGHSSLDRIRAAGFLETPCDCLWRYWTGENIAEGQKTAAEVMNDWMNSPGHRENILNPHYTQLGVGRDGDYWVQHFGEVQSGS